MNDREALEELLNRFGLTPATTGKAEGWSKHGAICLTADQKGIRGYAGLITVFSFDPDGTFQDVLLLE